MRRFFGKRDKKEPPPAPSPSSASQPSIASDPAQSSTSSDSHDKRSWRNWIGGRRSASFRRMPVWPKYIDDDDEDDDDDDDDDYGQDTAPTNDRLQRLLQNALVSPLPAAPFVQHTPGPLFPRSTNHARLLPSPPSVRNLMFRRRLLTRLQQPHLSPAEHAFIAHFRTHPPPPLMPPHPSSFPNASFPAQPSKVVSASPGVRRWIARPGFEDRNHLFQPVDGVIVALPVFATAAVAALEYSEHLDAMADPDFDHPTLPQTASHAPVQPPPPASKRNSYTAVPSPLRNQHLSSSQEPILSKSVFKRIVRFAEEGSDAEDAVPLHVVRMKKKREQKADFLRQERLKRAREEELERIQQDQELVQKEQDALDRERRRQAAEKERKEHEKVMYADTVVATRARREIQRAGGIVSSNTPYQSANLLVPSTSFSSLIDAERNKSAHTTRFSRTHHDAPPSISIPRREAFDPPTNSPASYHDSSPGSSRPPSMGYSPISLNSPGPGRHSRPPSTHSSSSDDVRNPVGSRRNSVTAAAAAGSGSYFARQPLIVSYPTWSGSNPNIQYIPPVPQFPDYVHDMPLLPPTAPFMKHSNKPRSSSSRNASPGGNSSSSRGSLNSSTEVVNQLPAPPVTTSRRPHLTHQRHGSGDSRNTSRTQQSQSSQWPKHAVSRSQPALSRGRPIQPQYPQAPSSWMVPTVPTPNGPMPMFVPVAVPVMPYSNVGLSSSGSNLQLHNQGMPMMGMPMNMNYGAGVSGMSGGGSGSRRGGSNSSKTQGYGSRQTRPVIS